MSEAKEKQHPESKELEDMLKKLTIIFEEAETVMSKMNLFQEMGNESQLERLQFLAGHAARYCATTAAKANEKLCFLTAEDLGNRLSEMATGGPRKYNLIVAEGLMNKKASPELNNLLKTFSNQLEGLLGAIPKMLEKFDTKTLQEQLKRCERSSETISKYIAHLGDSLRKSERPEGVIQETVDACIFATDIIIKYSDTIRQQAQQALQMSPRARAAGI